MNLGRYVYICGKTSPGTRTSITTRWMSSITTWSSAANNVSKSYKSQAMKLVPALEANFSIKDGHLVSLVNGHSLELQPDELLNFLVTKKKLNISPETLAPVIKEIEAVKSTKTLSPHSTKLFEEAKKLALSISKVDTAVKPSIKESKSLAENIKEENVQVSLSKEEDINENEAVATVAEKSKTFERLLEKEGTLSKMDPQESDKQITDQENNKVAETMMSTSIATNRSVSTSHTPEKESTATDEDKSSSTSDSLKGVEPIESVQPPSKAPVIHEKLIQNDNDKAPSTVTKEQNPEVEAVSVEPIPTNSPIQPIPPITPIQPIDSASVKPPERAQVIQEKSKQSDKENTPSTNSAKPTVTTEQNPDAAAVSSSESSMATESLII